MLQLYTGRFKITRFLVFEMFYNKAGINMMETMLHACLKYTVLLWKQKRCQMSSHLELFCVYAYRSTMYMSDVHFHRRCCNNPSSILSFVDANFMREEKITATPLSQKMATVFTQYSPFPSFALLSLCFTVVRD